HFDVSSHAIAGYKPCRPTWRSRKHAMSDLGDQIRRRLRPTPVEASIVPHTKSHKKGPRSLIDCRAARGPSCEESAAVGAGAPRVLGGSCLPASAGEWGAGGAARNNPLAEVGRTGSSATTISHVVHHTTARTLRANLSDCTR